MELSLTINDVTVSTSIYGAEKEIELSNIVNSLLYLTNTLGIHTPGKEPILLVEAQEGMRNIEHLNNFIAASIDYVTEADIEMITDTMKTKLLKEVETND